MIPFYLSDKERLQETSCVRMGLEGCEWTKLVICTLQKEEFLGFYFLQWHYIHIHYIHIKVTSVWVLGMNFNLAFSWFERRNFPQSFISQISCCFYLFFFGV